MKPDFYMRATDKVKPGKYMCFIYRGQNKNDALLMPFLPSGSKNFGEIVHIDDLRTAEAAICINDGSDISVETFRKMTGKVSVIDREHVSKDRLSKREIEQIVLVSVLGDDIDVAD